MTFMQSPKAMLGSLDEKLEFQRDPAAYLSKQGLSLSADAKKYLEANVQTQDQSEPDWGNFIQASSKDLF